MPPLRRPSHSHSFPLLDLRAKRNYFPSTCCSGFTNRMSRSLRWRCSRHAKNTWIFPGHAYACPGTVCLSSCFLCSPCARVLSSFTIRCGFRYPWLCQLCDKLSGSLSFDPRASPFTKSPVFIHRGSFRCPSGHSSVDARLPGRGALSGSLRRPQRYQLHLRRRPAWSLAAPAQPASQKPTTPYFPTIGCVRFFINEEGYQPMRIIVPEG